MDKVGDKIYKLRTERGFSQEELGFRVGVTRQTISQWEANRRRINPGKIQLLSELFKVDADFLVDDIEDRRTYASEASQNKDVEALAASADLNDETTICDACPRADKCLVEIKSTSIKARVLIVISVTLALVALGLILINLLTITPKYDNNASSVAFNFNAKDIFYFLSGFIIVDTIISVIVTAIYKRGIRNKIKKKNNLE